MATCCLLFLTCIAKGADAGSDPQGWNEVRFGMTAREVVNALDGKAQFQQEPQASQKPLTLDKHGTPDLVQALDVAKKILADAKESKDAVPSAEAAKRLVRLLKPRRWVFYNQGGPDSTGKPTKVLASRVFGTLEAFTLNFGEAQRAPIVIRPANRSLQSITYGGLFANICDEASERYLHEVEDAVHQLSGHIAAERQKEQQPAAEEHREVEVAAVLIRGIDLEPRIEFENGRVSKVVLSLRYAGEDGALFDEFGLHRTLCEALHEKFGPPDEKNNGAASAESVWRFPNTVVTCGRSRMFFSDSAFVRKGVWVAYAPPSAENARGDDNL